MSLAGLPTYDAHVTTDTWLDFVSRVAEQMPGARALCALCDRDASIESSGLPLCGDCYRQVSA